MIIGDISSKNRYIGVHPKMKQAFDFLDACFTEGKEPGRYELDGDQLYAIVFRYIPGEKANPRYETHDQYIDIQAMAAGSELQWYAPRKELAELTPYNAEKDISFYAFNGEGSKLSLQAGDFAVYFPEDGHLPGMPDGTTDECVRIVVKIKC